MDKSKKYIEMCEKVPKELQESLGDFVNYAEQGYCPQHKCLIEYGPDGICDCPGFLTYHRGLSIDNQDNDTKSFGSIYDCNWNKKWILLFHQDQLQDMVKTNYKNLSELIYFFWAWMERKCVEKIFGFNSMEQLWLAFVMHEKFKKIWNDKKKNWVIIE